MTCAQLRTKTPTPICRKICCVKSGSQILNAVEQLSSPFSKDKLKQGAQDQLPSHVTARIPADVTCDKLRAVQPGRLLLSL